MSNAKPEDFRSVLGGMAIRSVLAGLAVWLVGGLALDLLRAAPAVVGAPPWIESGILEISTWASSINGLSPAALLTALLTGFALEQTNLLRIIQDDWIPPRPSFLETREPGPDDLAPRSRSASVRQLHDWLRRVRKRRTLQIHGVFGAAGVGKSGLVVQLLSEMGRGWHAGRLIAPIPSDWTPRRPTLIWVDYADDANVFWQSGAALFDRTFPHPVTVIFESASDFEMMIDGQPEHKVAALRRAAPTHPRSAPQVGDTEGIRIRAEGAQLESVAPSRGRYDGFEEPFKSSIIEEAEARDASDEAPTFLFVSSFESTETAKLAMAFARTTPQWRHLSAKDRRALTSLAEEMFAATSGRLQPLIELTRRVIEEGPERLLTDSTLRNAILDPMSVPRADAEILIQKAVSAFPEEGLDLIILAALGQMFEFSADARHAVAPGSGDRRRLARLFLQYSGERSRSFHPDFAPSITDRRTAIEALIAVVGRLQRADLKAFVRRLSRIGPDQDADDLRFHLERFVETIWIDIALPLAPEDIPPVIACLVFAPEGSEVRKSILDAALAQARLQGTEEFKTSDNVFDRAEKERRATHFIDTLDALALMMAHAISDAPVAALDGAHRLAREVASHAMPAIMAADPSRRLELLKGYAERSPAHGPELAWIFAQPNWTNAERLPELLQLMMVLRARTACPRWLSTALGGKTGPQLHDAPHSDDAMKAFQLMDDGYRSSGAQNWSVEDTALVERLLRDGDVVEKLAATWAVSWYVRPTDVIDWPQLDAGIASALSDVIGDPETPKIVWKRAAASVAKLRLPALGDPLLDWARWADKPSGALPPVRGPSQSVPISRNALVRARALLADPSVASDVSRSAALLVQSADAVGSGTRKLAVQGLVNAVNDENLSRQQQETFILRLAQIGGAAAGDALVTIVKQRNAKLGPSAFIALCATGQVSRLELEELQVPPYGPLFVATWRRLIAMTVATDAAPAEGQPSTSPVPSPPSNRSNSLEKFILAARGHLIHKLKAKETSSGRWAYYFVLVQPGTEAAFLAAIQGDGTIDLEDFGEVVASSYGEEPTAEVREYLLQTYGFDV